MGVGPLNRREFLRKSSLAAAGAVAFPTVVPASVFGKNAPSNRILVGQIGCGRIARTHDLPEIFKLDSIRVVAVCDVDKKRLSEGKALIETHHLKTESHSGTGGVKEYADYGDLLADPEIDAVVISTPDHWHAQPAIEAVRAGKHVYLQKPASLTVAEGRQLADTVARTGRVLQIGCQQRSMPQFRTACEWIRNGRIGTLRKVKIGLPSDPAGTEEPEMPVPPNLDYDRWLGSTAVVYYTEKRVHPQNGYDRPGWLRCEQFGAGMITGWGSHHLDIAHWAMDTEYSGPVEVEAEAEFPAAGLWDVHGPFRAFARYANGVVMEVSSHFPNGVRFEGDDGWIFVTRGDYSVTASDPVSKAKASEALMASDPGIFGWKPGPDDVRLPVSEEQHADWIEAIRNRRPPIAGAEPGHRSCTACLLIHIAMKVKRKLVWDPLNERFKEDDAANERLTRPQRSPYGTSFTGRV